MRDQIEEIKSKLDIVEVVSKHVPTLKRSGRNFFAVCPFHSEKSPSFSVNPELGLFKCFGCGKGGDVIKFIEEIEKIEFVKALEMAADMAGVKLTRQKSSDKFTAERKKLAEVNELATKYFEYLLWEHDLGKAARAYLEKRKINKEYAKKFRLGYAPKGFSNLKDFLLKRKYTITDLASWGLISIKGANSYDKFRDRLMFPIFDSYGLVVGFSGRSISPDDKGPKYLNSPETLLYKKSKLLFGLFQAKESLRKSDFAVMVEGNVDIITAHIHGFGGIVAPLGTALTLEQLQILKRYVPKVYFAFDSDLAGEKALVRAIALCEQAGIRSFALDLGKYQDLDDLLREGGNMNEVLMGVKPVVEHLIYRMAKKFKTNTVAGKSDMAAELLPIIEQVQSQIEREEYLKILSGILGISFESLASEFKKKSKNIPVSIKEEMLIERSMEKSSHKVLLLAMLHNYPNWIGKIDVAALDELFTGELDSIWQHIKSGESDSKFVESLNELQKKQFLQIVEAEVQIFDDAKTFTNEVNKLIHRLLDERLRGQITKSEDLDQIKKFAEMRKQVMRHDLPK